MSLTDALRRRYSLKTITGHQHIAPVRKTDPGPFFDWQLYKKMLGETRKTIFDRMYLAFSFSYVVSRLFVSWPSHFIASLDLPIVFYKEKRL